MLFQYRPDQTMIHLLQLGSAVCKSSKHKSKRKQNDHLCHRFQKEGAVFCHCAISKMAFWCRLLFDSKAMGSRGFITAAETTVSAIVLYSALVQYNQTNKEGYLVEKINQDCRKSIHDKISDCWNAREYTECKCYCCGHGC